MSSRTTGNRYELRAKKELEAQGFQVEKANARIVWIKGRPISMHHDFFGCGDLIGICSTHVCLVQVKFQDENTGLWLAEVRRKMQTLPSPPNFHKEIWVYRKESNRIVKTVEVL